MTNLNVKSLVAKLNTSCHNALEAAAGLCMSRTNYNVEIEHWLMKLIEVPGGDLAALFRYYEVDTARLKSDLTAAIDRMKRGNSKTPALSPQTVELVRAGWERASVDFGAMRTRPGHLLYALLADDTLSRFAQEMSGEFEKISPVSLRKDLLDLIADSVEQMMEGGAAAPSARGVGPAMADSESGGPGPRQSSTPNLDQYTIDLTAAARAGSIDPVLGRDDEIRQIIDILTRRRQNNPILTGEAGVGKTAVVEGFARRIAAGDVPPALKDVSLRMLDLGLLQAGAGVRGEFENRLKSVIDEVKASPVPIILFIDEAHTMIGAGGAAGQGDAANMLKPALARGELRTIAATTWAEYKKYFERDAALARRFQVVKVEEPAERVGVEMMRGLVATLEGHHAVRILDEAVTEAVRLSSRYISGRQLPDKAVSLLDTACARVAMSHNATPPAVEDCRRRIEQLGVSIDIIKREITTGGEHGDRLEELQRERAGAEVELVALEERWRTELDLVTQVRELRSELEQSAGSSAPARKDTQSIASTDSQSRARKEADSHRHEVETADGTSPASTSTHAGTAVLNGDHGGNGEELRARLQSLTAQLRKAQGEHPLVQVCVDAQAVAEIVSNWTGIPVGRMVSDEIRTVLTLKERMEQRIIGQSHALEGIAQSIRTSRANLTDPRKPIGVFLMVGTSGVGKTETAIALAELLYGGEQNLTVINMSEFKEEHKVSLLMGSPPGYVGYGEGGVLTEAVRRKPYSVLLLDEMEKAHPGVQDVFYQVFDKGTLRDGEGRDIDFKNTVIIMTSNAGTDLITKLCADPETRPEPDGLAEALYPELIKTFKPAFLGRVAIVPYYPLDDEVMRKIIALQLGRVGDRITSAYRASFTYAPELMDHIAERCREVQTGARNVDHILTRSLLPELSAEFLARMADGRPIDAVHVSVGSAGFEYVVS